MKKGLNICLVILFLVLASLVKGQALLTNNASLLYLESGTLLHVEGDVVHEDNPLLVPGLTDNSGRIELDNNWINNTGFNVFINNSPGVVVMNGFNQSIAGTSPTQFHDLIFENSSQKSMYVDTWVDSMLYLTDAELRINDHIMYVRNTNPNSIQWNSGFVSGDSLAGYLARSTDRNTSYMYPVGSIKLNKIYRAVEIIPSTSDSAVYAVRVAGIDPELDFTGTSYTLSTGAFSRSELGAKVYGINDRFYHNIARFYSSNQNQTLNTKIFYFSSDEIFPHEFNGNTNWSNINKQWEVDNFEVNFSGGLYYIGSPDKFMSGVIANFDNDVYALTIKEKVVGNVPQIFSPNGDGLNDMLFVYGEGIDEVEFVIYNRWGEKIFETKDKNIGWNGMFKGKKAQPGVYVYFLKASLNTSGNIETSGDITLVR
jgi:gliding motility-associated-like protein